MLDVMEGPVKKLWCILLLLCLHFVTLVYHGVVAQQQTDEAKALQNFIEATLPSPSLQGFNFSHPLCTWYGLRCSGTGVVVGLFLEGIGLTGVIPRGTLGKLSSLTHFSLYNNSLQSPIPDDMWTLTSLQYLSLSLNSFDEVVPSQIANLTRLQRLDLSYNNFSGSVPVEVGQLQNLRYLYCSSNKFSGNIEAAIFDLPSIMDMDLSRNSFSGSIAGIENLHNLVLLNLSSNLLTGIVPEGLARVQSLSVLDLSYNTFFGRTDFLNASSSLETIYLTNNSFVGSLPQLKFAKMVRLNGNALKGPLQPVFGPQLVELDLSLNFFYGDIASFMNSSSRTLMHLDLSGNNISGSLTSVDFGSFPALEYVDLSSLKLEGPIPSSIGRATKLTYVDLSDNELSGRIPESFTQLGSLDHLNLSNNSLSGNVSQLLGMHSLSYLNLSYNKELGCNAVLAKQYQDAFVGVTDCQPAAADIVIPSMHRRSKSRLKWAVIIAIVAGCALAIALLLILFLVFAFRRRETWPRRSSTLSLKKRAAVFKDDSRIMSGPFSFESNSGPWAANVKNASSVPVVMFEKPLLNLTFADLLRATNNFNMETQVSQGGLGPVYRAGLPGGLHVSIKVLIEGRVLTNEVAAAEFANLAKIKHPNLVPLLGYCIVGEERLVIYEFMRSGGLHRWLLGSPDTSEGLQYNQKYYDVSMDLATRANVEPLPEAANLNWAMRHKVALGVARALAFLHHGQTVKMVHRDVKASNVMLDEEFEPHLANTGLAGLLAGSDDAVFAGGSPGYAPPEYGQPGGKVSTMGDVFSFGVILLELVTGKKPFGDTYDEEDEGVASDFGGRAAINDLVGWVRMLMQEKRPGSLVRALDTRACEDKISEGQMLEVLRMGYLCTAESPSKRPTIQQAVGLLKDMAPNITSP